MNTMGMADTVTKQYMKENTVFADAFNFLLYKVNMSVEEFKEYTKKEL